MKKLATAIAAIALIATPSFAADMAVKAPPTAPAPAYSWTGFYIGGNIGGGWGSNDVAFTVNDAAASTLFFPGVPPSVSFNSSGVLGGLQVGYNWQLNPNWLVGLESDFDFSGVKGAGTTAGLAQPLVGPYPFALTADEKVTWFGTVRGRFGYVPIPNLLIYGTGGFAYGRVAQTASFINNSAAGIFFGGNPGFSCVPGTCFVGNSTRVTTGWTAGGGIEYAFGSNWSLRVEYLFINLGSDSFAITATAPGNPGQTLSTFTSSFNDVAFHVARGGLNYRF